MSPLHNESVLTDDIEIKILPPPKAKKSVRFAQEKPQVHHVERWTEEENKQSYYNEEDFRCMSEECRDTIYAAQDQLLSSSQCTRGLERYIDAGRIPLQKQIVRAVIREQEKQRKTLGRCNPLLLGTLYDICTKKSKALAVAVGRMDALCVAAMNKMEKEQELAATLLRQHQRPSWKNGQCRPISFRSQGGASFIDLEEQKAEF